MRFKVPQNVQREDTIIGPLTLKQMGILGAGGGLTYAVFITLSKSYFIEVWLPPVFILTIITLAAAFLKIHSLPFHQFLMHLIEYHYLPKKRVWVQGSTNTQTIFIEEKQKAETQTIEKPPIDINEIAKTLDSHDKKQALQAMIKQNYQ